jgi:hypothetical protein
MSILHFVEQYQKIQDKIYVVEDGGGFKTDDKDRRRWSRFPIERHVATIYTKKQFYRFSKEFEKHAEYDVNQESEVHFRLVPNNTHVYVYGRREYIVIEIVDEQSYYCECCKFDRDGILCYHILKVFITLEIKIIPDNYILGRWAQEPLVATTGGGAAANMFVQPDLVARGMPLSGRRTLWFTNLSKAFADLAANGCMSIEAYKAMQDHIKIMRSKLNELKEKKGL